MMPELISHILSIAPGPMGNIQVVPKILFELEQSIDATQGTIKYSLDRTNPFVWSETDACRKCIGANKYFS